MHPALVTVIVIALFLAFIVFGVKHIREERSACEAKGGHVVDLYKSDLCVTEDGRIMYEM